MAEVVAGEAVSGTPEQRMADMMAIASVISNRAALLGVSPEQVVANSNEFNAYNRPLPPGVGDDIVAMAQEAIDTVAANGPTNNATFYATPASAHNLPGALSFETATDGHQFFSDPLGRAIGTSEGYVTPNQFAYAANPENVPTPGLQAAMASPWGDMAAAPPVEAMQPSPGWGLNKDVAPALMAPTETWSDMAAAQPVQTPMSPAPMGLLAGLPSDGFSDMAAAGPFGGQFAAPADRFAQGSPNTSQPFDRYVQTTSIPTSVDPNAYQPGSAPMIDVSAVPANRVQSVAMSPQPGLLAGLPTDGFSQMANAGPFGGDYAAPADRFSPQIAAAPQISQADIARGFFNATAANQMDPSFTDGLMSPQNPVVPTAVETTSYTPSTETAVDIANSRFSTPAKTSRIGQEPTFDTARMPGLFDPTTNTAALTAQPADIGGFLAAAEAQRGPPTGLLSAEAQAMQGHVYNESLKADAARQAAMVAANQALATPNFNQTAVNSIPAMATPANPTAIDPMMAINAQPASTFDPKSLVAPADMARSVQSVMPSPGLLATPQQQAAGYQQAAQTMAQAGMLNIGQQPPTDLSGELPTNFDVLGQDPNVVPAPMLDEVEVADQPTIAGAETMPAPMTAESDVQPATTEAAITAPSVTPKTMTEVAAKPTLTSSIAKMANPGTLTGGVLGALALGPAGGLLGGLLGNSISQNGGIQGLLGNSFSAPTTQMAGGINNIASIYGGSVAPGTYAVANNGATITAQPGGYTTYTNKYGVTEAIGPDGKISGYFGGLFGGRDPEGPTPGGTGGGGGYAPA